MPLDERPADTLVVGGGVIGLSIAYQLARDGLRVTLLERGHPGQEASWAGAGILPPASWYGDHPALDALAMAGAEENEVWSERLREATGLDDEYVRCGALYQETPQNGAYLQAAFSRWRSLGVRVERRETDPTTWSVPDEAQVRNPLRLRALVAACEAHGVRIVSQRAVTGFRTDGEGRLLAARTATGDYPAGAFCLAAGAWTPPLAEAAHSAAPGRPVRGQMVLLRPQTRALGWIVHRYPHYVVPRRDGLVLVGATLEEVGFDKQTTTEARQALLAAAEVIEPSLAGATVERHWAGLRPASVDPLPLIGPLPGVANAWVATGHHRCGLQLAPPTARAISAMIRGVESDLSTASFDPARLVPASAV